MEKTEVPGIYKKSEGVLVNRDNDSLDQYRRKREMRMMRERQINNMQEQIDCLSKDMEEIKSLLRHIAAK